MLRFFASFNIILYILYFFYTLNLKKNAKTQQIFKKMQIRPKKWQKVAKNIPNVPFSLLRFCCVFAAFLRFSKDHHVFFFQKRKKTSRKTQQRNKKRSRFTV